VHIAGWGIEFPNLESWAALNPSLEYIRLAIRVQGICWPMDVPKTGKMDRRVAARAGFFGSFFIESSPAKQRFRQMPLSLATNSNQDAACRRNSTTDREHRQAILQREIFSR
jgi:hypothetical protein